MADRALLHWLRRGASVLILLAVVDYFILPQVAGTEAALRLLRTVNPWGAAAAVALEAASLISYSLLTRSMLPDQRPSFSWLLRSDVAALGLSHLLPGGTATSSALRYRLMQQGGVPAGDAAVGLAVQGAVSTLMLAALFWLALIVSIPVLGLHRGYVIAALAGAILLAAIVVALVLHGRRPVPADEPLHKVIGLLPAKVRPRVQAAVSSASLQLDQLLADRRALGLVGAVGGRELAVRCHVAVGVPGRVRPSDQPGDPVRCVRHRQPGRHPADQPGRPRSGRRDSHPVTGRLLHAERHRRAGGGLVAAVRVLVADPGRRPGLPVASRPAVDHGVQVQSRTSGRSSKFSRM